MDIGRRLKEIEVVPIEIPADAPGTDTPGTGAPAEPVPVSEPLEPVGV